MEKVVEVFANHEEADAADRAYYRSLTPQQRLDLQLELIGRYKESLGEAGRRLERVCRVILPSDRATSSSSSQGEKQ